MIVTTFASNAARLETIGRVAEETGRRVCVAGRSLDRILKVAKATGYLRDFPETVRFDEAMRLPKSEVLVVATGGQGEARAALGRIAFGNHEIKLAEGDTVIFSSKQIPGNEVAIGRIMNALSELGALTVTERQAHVHVSGHPGAARACADVQVDATADPRAGAWREPPPARTGAVRARSGHSAGGGAGERPHHPARSQGTEEGWRRPRRPARARRRRHPSRRRSDNQRAAQDRRSTGWSR